MIKRMVKVQIQLPEPLYRRMKEIAERQEWSLAEVMRKAAEHFVERFPQSNQSKGGWVFPTLDCGGDFLIDPATTNVEADFVAEQVDKSCLGIRRL